MMCIVCDRVLSVRCSYNCTYYSCHF